MCVCVIRAASLQYFGFFPIVHNTANVESLNVLDLIHRVYEILACGLANKDICVVFSCDASRFSSFLTRTILFEIFNLARPG